MRTAPVAPAAQPPPPTDPVKPYHRRFRLTGADLVEESELGFDDSGPVQAILLPNPEVAELPPDASEGIGEKGTSR